MEERAWRGALGGEGELEGWSVGERGWSEGDGGGERRWGWKWEGGLRWG